MPKTTALEDAIEETKEHLKAATERENKEVEDAINAEDTPAKVDEPVPETKPEEPAKEKPAEEPKPEGEVAEEKPEHPRQARRAAKKENEELRERLERAEARLAEMAKPREEAKVAEVIPDKAEDPVAYAEYVARDAKKVAATALERLEKVEKAQNQQETARQTETLENAAKSELFQMEALLKKQLPDYDDVKVHYVRELARSIKTLNPKISDQQLVKLVDAKIYNDAIELYKDGYENPVHALYDQIKSNGYTPPAKQDALAKEVKPDLTQVARNKSRNAGTVAAAAGTGQGEVTPRYAATEMTVEEIGKMFATMSPQEKKSFYQSAGR